MERTSGNCKYSSIDNAIAAVKEYRRRIEMELQKERDEACYRENVNMNFRETNRRIDEVWKEVHRLQRLIETEDKKRP